MNIENNVKEMDALVSKGAIVEAVKTYFAEDAKTADYNDLNTSGKSAMVTKMQGFVGAIAAVNGIQHHQTTIGDNVSASEFTFDFDMKDGSKILWHEIIRRKWNEQGKVTEEQFFQA